jgi:hypothetical protein
MGALTERLTTRRTEMKADYRLRILRLRRKINALENEADAATQHARALMDEALTLRGELWDLEDGDPGTLSA